MHFKRDAPYPNEYSLNRYLFAARRHYTVLGERLSARAYLFLNSYTIVDMAAWGWARTLPLVLGDDAWSGFPHLKRLIDEITPRPAAQRAAMLKDRHAFKTDMDEEARRHLFRYL